MTARGEIEQDHYANLGLDRGCTIAQVRSAYRVLAKQHHPDLNAGSAEAVARTQALNTAYETLSDPARRRQYDRELDQDRVAKSSPRSTIKRDIAEDVHLRIEDFFRGASLTVRVNDPATESGTETYQVEVPADTAPGARLRVARDGAVGGNVIVRLRALPNARFKIRGADVRCDLRISARRASEGGRETITGPAGKQIIVEVPRRVPRGELLVVRGEGLPKPHGGRGDLIVRIVYRPEVRIERRPSR